MSDRKSDTRGSATQDALATFDALDVVDIDFMLGSWQGEGFETGHRLDGLLDAYRWHGKRFDSAEDVHPLVFTRLRGGLASVNPAFMAPALRWPMPRSTVMGRAFQLILPLITTSRSRARLRMTRYRGKESATMIYDQLPINDVFRKIDADTVLGAMDFKGMTAPFFFVLRRERKG